MSVVVNQLTKTYGQQKALDNISFELSSGEVLGFLGPNGAGKSTTMKILCGYIQQTSGTANVCGFDVQEQSIHARKNIGYLPELNPLYGDMFVREYLLFIADIQQIGKQSKRAVDEMISKTGLSVEQKKKISQLSKGFKQRVGLASALIHNPKVLILDEPTSGLDPNQVVEIRNLIKEIGRDKTIILSTHIMQEVEAMCNRVIIINKGKIVADDKIEKLQQQAKKEFIISVTFKNKPDKKILEQIQSVNSVIEKADLFIVKSKNDIREELSMIASKNNLLILSMSLEENSLEEVFQTLTK